MESFFRPRILAALFLAVSLCISVGILSTRNIYDDEHVSLNYVHGSVQGIIAAANSTDIHPPGMYLLARLAYAAIPSPRWMALFPLLFIYGGLAVFVLSVTPLFAKRREQVTFLLLATFHPQFLMWGNTIRWYSWWTGIALTTLVVALRPREEIPLFSYRRAVVLGLLLDCLYYLNYITLVFIAALAVGILVRYSWRIWKQCLVSFLLFVAVSLPQWHAMLAVHIANTRSPETGQRASVVVSFARLIQANFCSEAYMPLQKFVLFVGLVFVVLSVVGLVGCIRWVRARAASGSLWTKLDGLGCITVFMLLYFVLVGLSGLGIKPRNALILAPLLAPVAAMIVGTLRPLFLQYGVLGIFALWSAGAMEHLISRDGLAKSSMTDRPEEVVSFLRAQPSGTCSVVETYDYLLTFTLAHSDLPHVLTLTPFQNAADEGAVPFDRASCQRFEIYFVDSQSAGLAGEADVLKSEMNGFAASLGGRMDVHRFSFDKAAAAKRKFKFIPGAAVLPDYRFVLSSEAIDALKVDDIENLQPHFAPADGRSLPKEMFYSFTVTE
ncbi:hypothetical protein GOB94_04195 [Granulicella sp. 5B5]|uniref:hypothetical protein n=1 Tax=Granulicella sp. 5B5 TaxID=1617967 RepID=UPI0015F4DC4C|nr:hypothetical protein [Granulicella sp. 5B5]QMV17979.1 hypothetical protein GOB94_04195 [Granulicella sp. 5B5]